MARMKTTNSTNKVTITAKSKAPRKPKTTPRDTDAADEPKPLQATLGEQLKSKGKPPNPVRVTNFTRRLPCDLEPSDLKVRALRIQQLRSDITHETETLDNEKEAFEARSKSIKSNISLAQSEINKLTDEIAAQKEHRDTACQKIEDLSRGAGEVREIRLDIKELLQAPRPMNQSEIDGFYSEPPVPQKTSKGKNKDEEDAVVDDSYGVGTDPDEVDFD